MWFMLNICLPSGRLEFGIMLSLYDQPPVKILDTESLIGLLVDNISHMLSQFHAKGIDTFWVATDIPWS